MTSEKDFVVRSVRMPLWLDRHIKLIADFEDRTISKVIQRLLDNAIGEYMQTHADYNAYFEVMRKKYNWVKDDILQDNEN